MLEDMIGPETFRLGVSSYLKKYAYGSAVTEDLWAALDNQTNGEINISEVSYVLQMFTYFFMASCLVS